MAFDLDLIPESVMHEAVVTTLGDRMLVRKPNGYNFRCPVCGDSRSNPNDRNGWVLNNKDHWHYHCFKGRCGYSEPFLSFLKEYHTTVYNNVIFHAFTETEKKEERRRIIKPIKSLGPSFFDRGELQSLKSGHPLAIQALTEVRRRGIPESVYSKWFVAIEDQQYRLENGGKGNKYRNRLIIPYYKFNGTWTFFTGRDLTGKHPAKYMDAPVDGEFYNIEFLDTSRPFFILEGPIDSTFIPNAIAVGGTGGVDTLLREFPKIKENWKNATFIWDNFIADEAGEKMMKYTSSKGYPYFDWSKIDGISDKIKDINDLVLSGKAPVDPNGKIKLDYLTSKIVKPKLGIEESIKLESILGNIKVGI